MSRLENALIILQRLESTPDEGWLRKIDPRCKLIVTIIFLIAVLSVPLTDMARLTWFFVFPIIMSTIAEIPYSRIFKASLWVLPFVALIGIFNPFIDRQPELIIAGVTINRGWVTFLSIIIRGLLTVQGIILLIETTGFISMCRGMNSIGVPRFLTTQLLMVYRYITVLITEALNMSRARAARGFGRKNFPLKMWGQMIGQLLLRTIDRAEHIHRAMISRGFDGEIPVNRSNCWQMRDTLFLISSTAIIAILFFANFTQIPK